MSIIQPRNATDHNIYILEEVNNSGCTIMEKVLILGVHKLYMVQLYRDFEHFID